MNVDGGRCCEAAPVWHTRACTRLAGKWVIRRDGFCLNRAKPYTVYRHNPYRAYFYVWHVCATREQAQAYVDTLIRKYKDHTEEKP